MTKKIVPNKGMIDIEVLSENKKILLESFFVIIVCFLFFLKISYGAFLLSNWKLNR
jgi:hypothetical protein